MSVLGVLLRKELQATFTSPVGYTFIAVFLLVLGYTFSLTLVATRVANLNYIFHQIYVLAILLVPAATMRAFAEERSTDTLELLLTAPVRESVIVIAKFLATFGLILAMILGSTVYAFILWLYGDPDMGPIYSGYLALVLLAAGLVSLGIYMSSLTENQVVAAALTLGATLMLWYADSVAGMLPAPFDSVALNLSLIGHFHPLATGSVFVSDIGYFVTMTLLMLFLTIRNLEAR
jgi:ABC-2 type transport system permease protein